MIRAFALLSMLAAASVALAQEVKYVEVGPFDAECKNLQSITDFSDAKGAAGTVNPHAVIGKGKIGDIKLAVAVDADKADAQEPNLLRLDFTGEGKFDDKLVLRRTNPKNEALFGPAAFPVKIGDETIIITAQALYYRSDFDRNLSIVISSGMQAKCKVDGKEYLIRLLDGDHSNFTYTRKPVFSGPVFSDPGDTIAVYVEDDTPKGRKSIIKGFYGQPIPIEGKWYDITLSADRRKIEVTPFKGEMGKVKASDGDWSARLFGKKYLLLLPRSGDTIDVPVDTYSMAQAYLRSKPDKDGKRTEVHLYAPQEIGRRANMKMAYPTLTVSPDKEARLDLGRLEGKLNFQRQGDNVTFSLQLSDISGMIVGRIVPPENQKLDTPKIHVLDSDGKSVYETTLEYG